MYFVWIANPASDPANTARTTGPQRAITRRFCGSVRAADSPTAKLTSIREVLEGKGTAALVTPDRELARRVREELTRWGIDIEESSGEPLGQKRPLDLVLGQQQGLGVG